MTFEGELREECHKLITRFEYYARELRDDDRRRSRRTGKVHNGNILRPDYWSVDPSFDPYHVRKSSQSISRATRLSLVKRDYRPFNPISYTVPKLGGGQRKVSVFSVADATVSRRTYKSLLFKNKSRLSAYSYAYRDDLTAHDAIQHIATELTGRGRMFLAEYDFSKYFDSIRHDYLWWLVEEKKFLMTPLERHILESFLATELQDGMYRRHTTPEKITAGIPQGTSISLFLANVAAWEIDRAMERLGIGFARYADDTLIWSHDYGRICEAVDALTNLSTDIGAAINFKKSHGISIFAPEGAITEFKSKNIVEFVGYRFSQQGAGIRESAVQRIKKRIAYLVWSNLLEPLERGCIVPERFAWPIDRDYLVMIMQIRRYLYGNLTEAKLARLHRGQAKRIHYPGVMSYFPLVSDIGQLKQLDGWLVHTIYTSLQKRTRILAAIGETSLPVPHGLSASRLLNAKGRTSGGKVLDLSIPSFVRIGTLINRAANAHGPNAVSKSGGAQNYQYI